MSPSIFEQVTIRELLKWVLHMKWYARNSDWDALGRLMRHIYSFEAWSIYGARCWLGFSNS